MDFLDPRKKRANHIRLMIGYILVAIALAMGTLVLIFASYGYDLDRKTGQVIQNGMVFLSARPEAAEIYVNGKQQRVRTDARLVLPAGQYNLKLQRTGYRTWERGLTLEGGHIERMVYPLLIPTTLKTTNLQLYGSAPAVATQSLDKHWLLVQLPGDIMKYDLYDLTDPTKSPVTISLPTAVVSNATGNQTIEPVEWASNNRHVLLKHTYNDTQEFILLDREAPENAVNLNKVFKQTPSRVALRNKKADQFYLYDGATATLQTADLKTQTASPMLQDVLDFRAYSSDDLVAYTTSIGAPKDKTRFMMHDASGEYAIKDFQANSTYLMDIGRYDGHWYVAAGGSSEGRVYIYRDPISTLQSNSRTTETLVPTAVLKVASPSFANFSANGQFLAVESANSFVSYDIETDRYYPYTIKTELDPQPAEWIDGFHLTAHTLSGNTLLFDFDGTNQQALSPSTNVLPFFSTDYTELFNVAPAKDIPGRFAVTETLLKFKAE